MKQVWNEKAVKTEEQEKSQHFALVGMRKLNYMKSKISGKKKSKKKNMQLFFYSRKKICALREEKEFRNKELDCVLILVGKHTEKIKGEMQRKKAPTVTLIISRNIIRLNKKKRWNKMMAINMSLYYQKFP